MTENHQNFLGMKHGVFNRVDTWWGSFLYSDRLVNSAISGSNRAGRSRSVGKLKYAKNDFFQFQLGMGYGVRKMTARVWRVFLLFRSTFFFSDPKFPGNWE